MLEPFGDPPPSTQSTSTVLEPLEDRPPSTQSTSTVREPLGDHPPSTQSTSTVLEPLGDPPPSTHSTSPVLEPLGDRPSSTQRALSVREYHSYNIMLDMRQSQEKGKNLMAFFVDKEERANQFNQNVFGSPSFHGEYD